MTTSPLAPRTVAGNLNVAMSQLFSMKMVMTRLKSAKFPGWEQLTFDEASEDILDAIDGTGNRYTAAYLQECVVDEQGCIDVPDGCDEVNYILGTPAGGSGYVGGNTSSVDEQVWMASQFQGGGAYYRRWMGFLDTPPPAWGHPLSGSLVGHGGPLRIQLSAAPGAHVLLYYRGRLLCPEGLPLISAKQALNAAHYLRFIHLTNLFNERKATREQKQDAKSEYEQSINDARNEGMGDKVGLARLLDEKTSYHRHTFGSVMNLK